MGSHISIVVVVSADSRCPWTFVLAFKFSTRRWSWKMLNFPYFSALKCSKVKINFVILGKLSHRTWKDTLWVDAWMERATAATNSNQCEDCPRGMKGKWFPPSWKKKIFFFFSFFLDVSPLWICVGVTSFQTYSPSSFSCFSRALLV